MNIFSCTGPGNYVGRGGCDFCAFAVMKNDDHSVDKCLPGKQDNYVCQAGQYLKYMYSEKSSSHLAAVSI